MQAVQTLRRKRGKTTGEASASEAPSPGIATPAEAQRETPYTLGQDMTPRVPLLGEGGMNGTRAGAETAPEAERRAPEQTPATEAAAVATAPTPAEQTATTANVLTPARAEAGPGTPTAATQRETQAREIPTEPTAATVIQEPIPTATPETSAPAAPTIQTASAAAPEQLPSTETATPEEEATTGALPEAAPRETREAAGARSSAAELKGGAASERERGAVTGGATSPRAVGAAAAPSITEISAPSAREAQAVMQQETRAAAIEPDLNTRQTDGGAIMIVPNSGEQLARENARPVVSQTPTPAAPQPSAPPPVPAIPATDRETNREQGARQQLPPETARSLIEPTSTTTAAETGYEEEAARPEESAAASGAATREETTPGAVEAAPRGAAAQAVGEAAPVVSESVRGTDQTIESAVGEARGAEAVPAAPVVEAEAGTAEEGAPAPDAAALTSVAQPRGEVPPTGPIVGPEAGAALVAPPAPEELRAQIPERELTQEEFVTEVERRRTPDQSRAEAQAMLESLRADAEGEKSSILAEAEAQKSEISATAESQIASVSASVESEVASISALFTSARATLSSYIEQQKAAVQTQVATEITQVQTDTETRVAAIEAQLTERQTNLTAYAEEQRAQPHVIAGEEATRAASELEAAANEAERAGEQVASHYPGDEDPNPEKRSAAREVGSQSAADIREKIPGISEALHSKADEFSGRYMEYATGVNAQIDEARPNLTTALNDAANSAITNLQESETATLQALDDRLQVDMQALDTSESEAVARVQSSGEESIAQIQSGAEQALGEVDAGAAAIITEIDNTVTETEAVVNAETEPYVPGIADLVESTRAAVLNTSQTGRSQLATSAANARSLLEEVATSFAAQAAQLTVTAQNSAESVLAQSRSAIDQTLQARGTRAQQTLSGLATQQQGLVDEVLVQIDAGIANAESEMRGVNEQFRGEVREAADESITEAKKPLTDQTSTRAEAAARAVGGAWYEGFFSALWEIAKGFVILLVIAIVVAVIFGLTLGTALLIVGAIFLIAGVYLAYQRRSEQLAGTGASGGSIFLLALSDATGITGIREGWTGRDVVTGEQLGEAEKWRRGTLGWVTAIGLILGARGLRGGLRGGIRPTSIFRGRVNFSWGALLENIAAVAGELRSVGVSLWNAARRGAEALRELVRSFREKKPPPEEPPAVTTPRMTIPERLAEYYRRLQGAPRARTADEGLQQVREILNQVEDEFSGVPRKDPPPPPNMPDGRMYPPLDDFVTRHPDGSLSARTRGHNIEVGADGHIRITNRRTGVVELDKPGAGGAQ